MCFKGANTYGGTTGGIVHKRGFCNRGMGVSHRGLGVLGRLLWGLRCSRSVRGLGRAQCECGDLGTSGKHHLATLHIMTTLSTLFLNIPGGTPNKDTMRGKIKSREPDLRREQVGRRI